MPRPTPIAPRLTVLLPASISLLVVPFAMLRHATRPLLQPAVAQSQCEGGIEPLVAALQAEAQNLGLRGLRGFSAWFAAAPHCAALTVRVDRYPHTNALWAHSAQIAH